MQVITDNLQIIVPTGLLILAGLGWFIRRHLTGQSHVEDHDSIEATIRLKRMLDEEGMTIEEAKALRAKFRQARGGLIGAEAQAISAKIAEAEERAQNEVRYDSPHDDEGKLTTVGMGLKAQAELKETEEILEAAVADFSADCTDLRAESLKDAQQAWLAYRDEDARLYSLLAEGGTLASLLYIGQQISLTEQRIKDIRLMQADANL